MILKKWLRIIKRVIKETDRADLIKAKEKNHGKTEYFKDSKKRRIATFKF